LDKIEDDITELKSEVDMAKKTLEGFIEIYTIAESLSNCQRIEANESQLLLDLRRLDTMEEYLADLRSIVQSIEENLRKVEETVVEVQENVRTERTVEHVNFPFLDNLRADFVKLNNQLSDQLQTNFQTFVDEFEQKSNDLQVSARGEMDEIISSVLNLQDDLHSALSEIQDIWNAKVNQCDVADMKQHFLGLLEANKLEIQKRFGLEEVTEAAGTSKRLKGVQCLSCGEVVEQCKIDEPKRVTMPLIYHRSAEERPRSRPCGGAHTIILPEERIEKKSNFLEEFGVEPLPPANTSYLVGSDGRYYLAAPPKCEETDKSLRD
jgi:hypothetical protein